MNCDFVLEQRVGAHHHRCATGNLFQGCAAGLALELACQPGDFQAQGLEPALEGDEVLLGEDFRRRHQCHLVAGFQCLQGGQGGDHGLAGAHVALDQPQHGLGLAQVVGDLVAHALLRAGGSEAQVLQVLDRQFPGQWQHRGALGAQAVAQTLLGQLVGQQFLERQAVLGPVVPQGQFVDIGVRRRVMQVADRIVQGRQLIVPGQLFRQPVGQAARAQQGQALLAQQAQALLGQAFGQGVDGCQGLVHRRRLVAADGTVFRVVDLQARGAGPGFAIAAHTGAALQAVLLRIAEMVEAQAQAAGTVLQAHQQAAALAHDHIGATDGAFDHSILARAQGADRHHAGAVLVAQGQVEQHVLKVFQADLGQLLGHGFADALSAVTGTFDSSVIASA